MDCRIAACAVAVVLLTGCAELSKLSALVQAPRFEQAPDHRAEIRMTVANSGLPIAGAGVRLWANVTNPNPFSLTLGTLKGTLFLGRARRRCRFSARMAVGSRCKRLKAKGKGNTRIQRVVAIIRACPFTFYL